MKKQHQQHRQNHRSLSLKKRRAFSVIELIITIAVSTVAIGVTVLALARVHHVDTLARASNDLDRTIARLADRLRQDCSTATSVEVTEDGVAKVQIGKDTITYKSEDQGLVRRAALGNKKTFDTFPLPSTIRYGWTVQKRKKRQVLVLSFQPTVAKSSSSLSVHAHSVLAVVGSDIGLASRRSDQ